MILQNPQNPQNPESHNPRIPESQNPRIYCFRRIHTKSSGILGFWVGFCRIHRIQNPRIHRIQNPHNPKSGILQNPHNLDIYIYIYIYTVTFVLNTPPLVAKNDHKTRKGGGYLDRMSIGW